MEHFIHLNRFNVHNEREHRVLMKGIESNKKPDQNVIESREDETLSDTLKKNMISLNGASQKLLDNPNVSKAIKQEISKELKATEEALRKELITKNGKMHGSFLRIEAHHRRMENLIDTIEQKVNGGGDSYKDRLLKRWEKRSLDSVMEKGLAAYGLKNLDGTKDYYLDLPESWIPKLPAKMKHDISQSRNRYVISADDLKAGQHIRIDLPGNNQYHVLTASEASNGDMLLKMDTGAYAQMREEESLARKEKEKKNTPEATVATEAPKAAPSGPITPEAAPSEVGRVRTSSKIPTSAPVETTPTSNPSVAKIERKKVDIDAKATVKSGEVSKAKLPVTEVKTTVDVPTINVAQVPTLNAVKENTPEPVAEELPPLEIHDVFGKNDLKKTTKENNPDAEFPLDDTSTAQVAATEKRAEQKPSAEVQVEGPKIQTKQASFERSTGSAKETKSETSEADAKVEKVIETMDPKDREAVYSYKEGASDELRQAIDMALEMNPKELKEVGDKTRELRDLLKTVPVEHENLLIQKYIFGNESLDTSVVGANEELTFRGIILSLNESQLAYVRSILRSAPGYTGAREEAPQTEAATERRIERNVPPIWEQLAGHIVEATGLKAQYINAKQLWDNVGKPPAMSLINDLDKKARDIGVANGMDPRALEKEAPRTQEGTYSFMSLVEDMAGAGGPERVQARQAGYERGANRGAAGPERSKNEKLTEAEKKSIVEEGEALLEGFDYENASHFEKQLMMAKLQMAGINVEKGEEAVLKNKKIEAYNGTGSSDRNFYRFMGVIGFVMAYAEKYGYGKSTEKEKKEEGKEGDEKTKALEDRLNKLSNERLTIKAESKDGKTSVTLTDGGGAALPAETLKILKKMGATVAADTKSARLENVNETTVKQLEALAAGDAKKAINILEETKVASIPADGKWHPKTDVIFGVEGWSYKIGPEPEKEAYATDGTRLRVFKDGGWKNSENKGILADYNGEVTDDRYEKADKNMVAPSSEVEAQIYADITERMDMILSRENSTIKTSTENREASGWFGKFHRFVTLSDPYEIEIKAAKQKISSVEYARSILEQAKQEKDPAAKMELINSVRRMLGMPEITAKFVESEKGPLSSGLNRVSTDRSHYEVEEQNIDVSRDVAIDGGLALGAGLAVGATLFRKAGQIAAKEVVKMGMKQAAKEGARTGAKFGVISSAPKNIEEVQSGNKTVGEAVVDTTRDTAVATVLGAGIGAGANRVATALSGKPASAPSPVPGQARIENAAAKSTQELEVAAAKAAREAEEATVKAAQDTQSAAAAKAAKEAQDAAVKAAREAEEAAAKAAQEAQEAAVKAAREAEEAAANAVPDAGPVAGNAATEAAERTAKELKNIDDFALIKDSVQMNFIPDEGLNAASSIKKYLAQQPEVLSSARKLFNLNQDATEDMIGEAYRKLAVKYHPDKIGDSSKMTQLAEAYDILIENLVITGRKAA